MNTVREKEKIEDEQFYSLFEALEWVEMERSVGKDKAIKILSKGLSCGDFIAVGCEAGIWIGEGSRKWQVEKENDILTPISAEFWKAALEHEDYKFQSMIAWRLCRAAQPVENIVSSGYCDIQVSRNELIKLQVVEDDSIVRTPPRYQTKMIKVIDDLRRSFDAMTEEQIQASTIEVIVAMIENIEDKYSFSKPLKPTRKEWIARMLLCDEKSDV